MFAVFIRQIGELLYNKFIQQDTIYCLEMTGLFAIPRTDIFETWLSVCPAV